MNGWSIAKVWNEKLSVDQKPYQPREHIRASEIGGPFLDRYYKMKGIQPTNPYDARTLRIFDCGHIFEWIVERIFKLAGILEESQETISIPAEKTLLEVRGRLDFIVGGRPEWTTARDRIKEQGLPEWLEERALKLIDQLEKIYPQGLNKVIAEIKSVNSNAFWAKKNMDRETGYFKGYDHHKLQLLTYLLGYKEIKKGKLFYVSKDDLCLGEMDIQMNEELKEQWEWDRNQMSFFYLNQITPDREPDINFDPTKEKFVTNWRVERSPYLTKITGFDNKEEWTMSLRKEVNERNKEYRDRKKKNEEKT